MQPIDAELAARNVVVEQVVRRLAAGQYGEVLRLAPKSRVTAEEIHAAVKGYGRHLVPMPQSAYDLIDYVAVQRANPEQWSVVVPLFTEEEGLSDLSLELTMVALQSGVYEVQVDDIHVL